MDNIAATLPVRDIYDVYHGAVLPILLKDKTTGENIIWATDEYASVLPNTPIEFKEITGGSLMLIRPRIAKSINAQKSRTQKRAEVFTPTWVCNHMNNCIDNEYLGYAGAFNNEWKNSWETNYQKVQFGKEKNWQEYIDLKKLEITCGEAPFVTSRYNTTDGTIIKAIDRIGFLDRKLRIAAENTDKDEYKKWSMRSLESSYGYEFQGDNLLIARINVFLTWVEHWELKLNAKPDVKIAKSAANVISWNFWQMDGLSGRTPQIKKSEYGQISIPGFERETDISSDFTTKECLIFDWRRRSSHTYNFLKLKEKMK